MIMNDTVEQLAELEIHAKYGKHLAGLIHNLNTPLMGISGRMELLQMKMPELKGLTQIADQVERINTILSDMVSLIEAEKNEVSTLVNLKDIVTLIDNFLQCNMNYKHKLEVLIQVEEISVLTIPLYLINSLYELIIFSIERKLNKQELQIIVTEDRNEVIISITSFGKQLVLDEVQYLEDKIIINNENLKIAEYYCKKNHTVLEIQNEKEKQALNIKINKIN